MHPAALAKRTKLSNQHMVEEVQALADLVGAPEATKPLAKVEPSVRRPAVTALKEREAVTESLKLIREQIGRLLEQQHQPRSQAPEPAPEPESESQSDNRTTGKRQTKASEKTEKTEKSEP